MKKAVIRILLACPLLLFACLGDEPLNPNYPEVVTNPVGEITTLGATFSSSIKGNNVEKIVERGFIWGTDPLLANEVFRLSTDSVKGTTFSLKIRSALAAKRNYYVRAYVKTSKMIYGNIVLFYSLGSEGPVVTNLSKSTAAVGDTVIINGRNFAGGDQFKLYYGNSTYSVFDITVGVISVTTTQVKFVLPANPYGLTFPGPITVSMFGNVPTLRPILNLDEAGSIPRILSIVPSTIKACDTVTIIGKKISVFNYTPLVSIPSADSYSGVIVGIVVIKSTPDTIVVKMPAIPSGELQFSVYNGYTGSSGSPDVKELRPEITSYPTNYVVGDTIELKVKNFPFCATEPLLAYTDSHIGFPIVSISANSVKVKITQCDQDFKINLGYSSWGVGVVTYCSTQILSTTAPVINSIQPSHATVGETVTIFGSNLTPNFDFITVTSSSSTRVTGKVIEMWAPDGDTTIHDVTCNFQADFTFTYDPPVIQSLSPSTVSNFGQLEIKGVGFSDDGVWRNKVFVDGKEVAHVYDQNRIMVDVDQFVDGTTELHGSVSVVVQNGTGLNSAPASVTVDHTASWFELKDAPYYPTGSSLNLTTADKAYVGPGDLYQYLDRTVLEYDPSLDKWTEKTLYPGSLSNGNLCGATYGGVVYMGIDGHFHDWWAYYPSLNKWEQKKDYPGVDLDYRFSFTIGTKIYIGGGYDTFELWEYDTVNDSWVQKQSPPGAIQSYQAFSFKGQGYAYWSYYQQYESIYDPSSDTWSTRSINDHDADAFFVFDDEVVMTKTGNDARTRFYKFTPGTDLVEPVQKAGVDGPRYAHFVIGATGYCGVGYNNFTGQFTPEFWKFDPAKL